MKRPWTPAEINRIVELRAQGLTHSQIATVLGRTQYAVARIIARHELWQYTGNAWTMPQVREMLRLYAEGHTIKVIASRMNRTTESIRCALKRHASR